MNRKGFTLIELLIVVVIIGVQPKPDTATLGYYDARKRRR